jgi:hypothetical protein
MHDDFEYSRYRNPGREKIYALEVLRFPVAWCALPLLFAAECALRGVPAACRAFKTDADYIRRYWRAL